MLSPIFVMHVCFLTFQNKFFQNFQALCQALSKIFLHSQFRFYASIMKWKYEHMEEKMPLCMSKCTQEKKPMQTHSQKKTS